MKIYQFDDPLFTYSAYVVAANKKEAMEIFERRNGKIEPKRFHNGEEVYTGIQFVKEHKIESGLFFDGGGNG